MTTETTTAPTTRSKSTATVTPTQKGKIAIVWEPNRDRTVPQSPPGADSVRIFSYMFVDEQGTEQSRLAAERSNVPRHVPVFKTLTLLLAGLNWIDINLWQEAKDHSRARTDLNDPIGQHLSSGALIEFNPLPEIQLLRGTLAEYSLQDATVLARYIHSASLLRSFQQAIGDVTLLEALDKRIQEIESGSHYRGF